MSGPLIILTGVIYLYVAGEQLARGTVPMFITYVSYATANIGLYLLAGRH